ncbi:methyl-accepting chemotaxis protein [Photobacterium lutimaris]|uniref:methyl-accepting chemotaxis protein n=1 Tax=Photobacterium lutimaris TaxID=388278 RepID=UPI001FB82F8D|nr:methyl-accepting chemotaxis protein [Photobacterium lutimaris]
MKLKLGFKARIHLTVMLLMAVCLTTLGMVNINSLQRNMVASLTATTEGVLAAHVREIENWLQDRRGLLENTRSEFHSGLTDQENLSLIRVLAKSDGVANLAIAYQDGRTFAAKGGNNGVFDVSDIFISRDWYINAMRKGATVISDPYLDLVSGEMVVSVSTPLANREGVLTTDISLVELIAQISQVDFAGGAATLSDSNNVFIASDDPSDIGLRPSQITPEWRFIESAFSDNKQGVLDIHYLDIDFKGYFKRVELGDGSYWTMMMFIDEHTALADVRDAIFNAAVAIVLLTLASTIAVTLLLNRIYQPLVQLKQATQNLSSGHGDLTQRLNVEGEDDLAQIGAGFNQFIGNIQQMMLRVNDASQGIAASLEQLGVSAQQSKEGLGAHSRETEQVVTAMAQMSEAAQSVAQSISKSTEITQCASAEASQSQRVVSHSVSTVSSLIEEFDAMAADIVHMNQDANQISAVLSVIGEIAEQTNLLALNAAIEAARAGEQGRGFAVVADEVRALAGRTQQSTSEIGDMLTKLLNGTKGVVTAMERTRERCQEAAETSSEVSGSLESLFGAVGNVEELSGQISTAAEEQNAVAQEVNNNMLAIRDIVDVLVLGGEQTLSVTQDLQKANTELASMVGHFKVS